jgi:hypothetical protein
MSVHVEQLMGMAISRTIEMFCGPVLDPRENEVFDYCQALGDVYLGFVDDKFVCCWGLVPPTFLSTQAYLWMWAPEPIKHQFVFIRHSQMQIQKMLERYERVTGYCEVRAKSARRWLSWLGAEFGERNGDILPFVINRRN